MKYKVFLSINGSGENGAGVATFYTRAQAVQACEQWVQNGAPFFAYLWDGSDWTSYAFIP